MEPYIHKVQYYETDKMGIVHHSNYIRWMEEARIDFLERIGWAYDRLEAEGVLSPVIGVDCKYKVNTVFPDRIEIYAAISEYTGVKFTICYVMKKDGKVVAEGHSEHCLLDQSGKILRIKKQYPALHELFTKLAEETVKSTKQP